MSPPAPSPMGGPGRDRLRWRRSTTVLAVLLVLVAALGLAAETAPQLTNRLLHAVGLNQGPLPGLGESEQRLLPSVRIPGSKRGYTFMTKHKDGSPVTFSPCRRWEVVVNTAGAPDGAYRIVQDAVATVRRATGLDLTVTGRTDEQPTFRRDPYQPDRYGDRWAPILVGWTDHPDSGSSGREHAGEGGPITATGPDGQPQYVSGVVGIDLDGEFNTDRATLRAIVLHELGHVVGLGHVDHPEELMYPIQDGQLDFGRGDLAGLARLGNGPCAPGI